MSSSVRKYQSAVLVGKVNKASMDNLRKKSTGTPQPPDLTPVVSMDKQSSKNGKKVNGKKKKTAKTSDEGFNPTLKDSSEPGTRLLISQSSTENVHHRLDGIVENLIKQRKQKPESISHTDLRTEQYRQAINSNSLEDLKNLLVNAMRENFELKQELLQKDAKFLQLQLDQINGNLRKRRPTRNPVAGTGTASKSEICQILEEASIVEKDLKVRLARTEIDLIERTNMLREVAGRAISLEEKCERLEQENDFLRKTHGSCIKSLMEKNEVLERRCEKSDNRRKLEKAGLSEEIRECKMLLRNLSRNVNKCARLFQDTKLDLKGKEGNDLEMAFEEETGAKSSDRLTNWILKAKPQVAEKAMQVWTKYLQDKVETLEGQLQTALKKEEEESETENKVEVLYSHKKDNTKQRPSSAPNHRPRRRKQKWTRVTNDDVSNTKVDKPEEEKMMEEVPPSPTWVEICHRTGLNPDARQWVMCNSSTEYEYEDE